MDFSTFERFTGEFYCVARLVPKPGNLPLLLPEIAKIKAHVDAHEPGVLRYEILQDGEEACVLEKYVNGEAMKTHVSSDVAKEVLVKLQDLLVEGGFTLKAYEAAKF